MKIFKKRSKFVTREEFDVAMGDVKLVLEGMQVATRQQAQMLSTIASQLAQVSKKPQEEKKEEEVNDPSFQ